MKEPHLPCLLAQVFVDRILWFMTSCGELIAHGAVKTYEELRGVQVRAGVLEVVLCRAGGGFHLPEKLTYRGEWCVGSDGSAAQLEKFFAQAARDNSGQPSGKATKENS